MPKSEESYENVVLTQLYSRKMTSQNFNRVRGSFRKKTSKDLCEIIKVAHDDMAKKIAGTPRDKLADRLRVDAFKLLDYSIFLGFCKRKQE